MLSLATEVGLKPPRRLISYWYYKTLRDQDYQGRPTAHFNFVSAARIKRIYKKYGGVSKATTVLSFPWHENQVPGEVNNFLGEVYICPAKVVSTFGKGPKFNHGLRQIVVHATLHLLGWDHARAKDLRAMEELENRILKLQK